MNRPKSLWRWTALAIAALLAGCAAPATAPLDKSTADAPRFAGAPEWPRSAPAAPWGALGDTALLSHIERALAGNLDVAQAVERVQRSRALAAADAAARWPALTASLGAVEREDRQRSGSASAGIELAWEVDVFGRLRHASHAQRLRIDAAVADADAVRRAVAAEVAQAWYALASANERLSLTQAVIDNRRATLTLVQHRARAGLSAPLDEARARSDLAAVQADVPALQAQAALALNRLAVLAGDTPGTQAMPSMDSTAADPAAITLELPDGETWLASRPDVAAAEARMRALSMDAEAVRSEFLPRISVGGFVGWLAGSAVGLSSASTGAWLIAPSVSLPVFNAGRLQARLDAARAQEHEALLHYRQRVLLATEEVENALAQVSFGRARLTALQERSREAVRAEQLARLRYQSGASDLLELLDAQRSAQQAQLVLAEALGQHRQDVTLLLRALGAV
ncbi:MAG: efflux transporter outer membrane subunit [Hydrogenophaga sp.]|uniref:efflux transporter outer membrane subunit n=1 Tax=Hydrogenophaga sp. TaxID=1904254 RepID=UPI001DC4D2EB|nr:efflux transporter outer membrane subunit [Hydrogenophaga sp.]MBX3608687.1 efflux transporter outer membrane subunit [Hydrogenophaga sp.]